MKMKLLSKKFLKYFDISYFIFFKYIFSCWSLGIDGMVKMTFCESFVNQIKWQSQSYTLHLCSLYRRHNKMRPATVRALTTKVLFVRFYIKANIYYTLHKKWSFPLRILHILWSVIIEILVRTLYVYDYDEKTK